MKSIPKWNKRLLALCLALALAVPAGAEGEEVHIDSREAFLNFAEACRLDTFSRNITVYLDADLDLTGAAFEGIPVFTGSLFGQGHCISGLNLEKDGSVQGLFRYLGETALVQDLTVKGRVAPGGSGCTVGGIAGSNSGTIQNCFFEGSVSGSEQVGGIAGINSVTGSISGCTMTGNLQGNHFAGGIAGENQGLLRDCTNYGSVNDSAQENDVELSDVTLNTLLSTEQANAATDIAGIAGSSSGVIRGCSNHGNIGYAHMGYNVGGIAGTQSGYIADCRNTGVISGRKEVGGIVGQMEPILKIEFAADTLQILRQQLTGTSALAGQASANALNHASQMGTQIQQIQEQSQTAKDAIAQLLPSEENPSLPDPDRILAAQNTLADSMAAMQESMQNMAEASQQNMETAAGDFQAISNQITAMSNTLANASDQLGGTITDVSDWDTPEDLTGKVENCENRGNLFGDLNVGGIAGAIGMERDLASEEEHPVSGNRSLNFNSQLRSVISACSNAGKIAGKKKNIGGIVGQMSMGLVKESVNNSTVEAENGNAIGGIAGVSEGYIRTCFAKCRLSGDTAIGGIAGICTRVSDCRSIAEITAGKEKLGAILGEQEAVSEETPVSGNLYLVTDRDYGGIDGISYGNAAAPMQLDGFLQLEPLPDCFYSSEVCFRYADASGQSFQVPTGSGLNPDRVPEVRAKEGYNGTWKNLDREALQNIYFDTVFDAEYTSCFTAAASQERRTDGKPIMLLQGQFREENPFALEACSEFPALKNTEKMLECWEIPELLDGKTEKLRISLPENVSEERISLRVCCGDGTWNTVEAGREQSFLTVSVQPGDRAVCLVQIPSETPWAWYAAGAAGVILISAGAAVHTHKKRKMKKQAEEQAEEQTEEQEES